MSDHTKTEAAFEAFARALTNLRASTKSATEGVAKLSEVEEIMRRRFGSSTRVIVPSLAPQLDATVASARILSAELERLALLLEGRQTS